MQAFSLEDYPVLQKWTRRSKHFVFFTSVTSGVTTCGGFKEYAMGNGDGLFNSVFGPLLLTLVSVCLSVYGFSYLYERYPLARDKEAQARLHLLILFIVSVLLATSSYFTVIHLAGPRCLERKLQADLVKAEQVFDELVKIRTAEKSLLPPLRLAAEKSGVLAEGERKGTLSQRKGDGKVVANISGLKKGYANIAGILEDSITEHESEAIKGRTILEQIRSITNDNSINAQKKASLIAPLFNSLNQHLMNLNLSAVPNVVASVQNIDDTNLAQGNYMDRALEAIKKPVQKTKQEILQQAALFNNQRQPVIPHLHVIDSEQAVFAFPQAALFAIAFAISVDAGIPIFCLFCLYFIGRREITNQQTQGLNHGYPMQNATAGASPSPAHESLWRTNNSKDHQGNKSRSNRGNGQESPVA